MRLKIAVWNNTLEPLSLLILISNTFLFVLHCRFVRSDINDIGNRQTKQYNIFNLFNFESYISDTYSI
jgi:hypothetical protein